MAIYKNHVIETHYLPGSDFKICSGVVISRKPRKEDIDFFTVTAPDGVRWNEANKKDAKMNIDRRIAIGKAD